MALHCHQLDHKWLERYLLFGHHKNHKWSVIFLGLNVTNKAANRLKIVPHSQMEVMAQMLVDQGRRLRELEVRLQKEKQEKANLEVDFQHLLDQLSLIATVGNMHEDHAMVCG